MSGARGRLDATGGGAGRPRSAPARAGRAQAVVEFALVAPILLLAVVLLWDGGSVLYQQVIQHDAARAGARAASLVLGGASATEVDEAVRSSAPDPPTWTSANPAADVVRVSVRRDHDLFTPLLRTLWGDASGRIAVTATADLYLPRLVAYADSATTPADVPVVVSVLANDRAAAGETLVVAASTPGARGTVSCTGAGQCTYTPDAGYQGTDVFTYTVTAPSGVSATARVDVVVTAPLNVAPVASDDAYSTDEDTTLSIAAAGVLTNDTDADGDTLQAVLVAAPTRGMLTLASNGGFSYAPTSHLHGTDSFTYRASDGTTTSNVATVTFTVRPINDAPVITSTSLSTPEDTPLTINLALYATDVETATTNLTYSVVTGPGNGTLSGGGASITYTPATNFNGADTLQVQATDRGDPDGCTPTSATCAAPRTSATATITITVGAVNDPPVAANDAYATAEDTPLSVAAPGVLANDADPDGPSLTAALVSGPTRGTLTLNANGSFTYTPNANLNGADSFTYRVSDGAATSNVATVSLTVTAVNDPPVPQPDSATTLAGSAVAIAVLTNDSDPEGDALSVTSPLAATATAAGGSVSCTSAGVCTFTPASGFSGTDSFSYTMRDAPGATASATVTITVTPSADLAITSKTGTPDPVVAGNVLTYTIGVRNNGPTAGTSVSVTDTLPAGLTFSTAATTVGSCAFAGGTVTCTLGTLASGATATITIRATATGAATLTNTATVSTATSDPVASNNAASVTTTSTTTCSYAVAALGPKFGYYLTVTTPAAGPITASWTLSGGASDNISIQIYAGVPADLASSANPGTVNPPPGAVASGGGNVNTVSATSTSQPAGTYTVYVYNVGASRAVPAGSASVRPINSGCP